MKLKLKEMYYSLFSSPKFILRIEQSKIEEVTGKVNSGFIRDCNDLVEAYNISEGLIIGKNQEYNRVSLQFSSEIPKNIHQQIRNMWGVRNY